MRWLVAYVTAGLALYFYLLANDARRDYGDATPTLAAAIWPVFLGALVVMKVKRAMRKDGP